MSNLTTAIEQAEKAAEEALDSIRERLRDLYEEAKRTRETCKVLTTMREPSEKMERAIMTAVDHLADGKPHNGRPAQEGAGESVDEELVKEVTKARAP